jgi:hypothetical protein
VRADRRTTPIAIGTVLALPALAFLVGATGILHLAAAKLGIFQPRC